MKGLVLALSFVSVILISGCINISPEQLALANPLVEQFLEEYPNARVTANYFSEERSAEILENITSECANPYMEAKDYYRVMIDDPDSGLKVIAWIDWDEKQVECAVKYGTGEKKEISKPGEEIKECKSHHHSKCYNGHVYWFDSCGNREEKKEYCEHDCDGGFCVNEEGCDEHHSFDCHNGHLYWFDSCGNVEGKKQACPNGCENGQCKEGECESHHDTVCHGGHVYWVDSCGNKEGKKEYCEHGCEAGACISEGNCTSNYEYKCHNGHVYWYDSCGNVESKKKYCEHGCLESECIETEAENCTDSDGGRNYYEAGTATKGSQSLSDHCNSDGTLTEKYCEGGEIKAETVECPEGYECAEGKCVSQECASQYEYNCYNGHVYWYDSCGNKEKKKEYCEHGCEAGACLENEQECVENWVCSDWSECGDQYLSRACEDTNNCGTEFNKPETERSCCYDPDGKDIFVTGETKGNYVNGGYQFITYHDTCYQDVMGDSEPDEVLKCLAEECYVMEHWAIENGSCESELILCEIGCASGRCVTNISEICDDSDDGQAYDIKGTVTTYSDSSFDDYCDQYGLLHEYYCDENADWKVITYPCSNDCENGACLPE